MTNVSHDGRNWMKFALIKLNQMNTIINTADMIIKLMAVFVNDNSCRFTTFHLEMQRYAHVFSRWLNRKSIKMIGTFWVFTFAPDQELPHDGLPTEYDICHNMDTMVENQKDMLMYCEGCSIII